MFEKQLELAQNIYDIMAISYIHIHENESNMAIEKSDDLLVNQILLKYVEDKILNPCKAFNNLKSELLTVHKEKTFSTTDFINLFLGIDSYISYDYKCSTFLDSTFKTYNSLNIYFEDKVKIYPALLSNYREHLNSIYKSEYNCDYLRAKKAYDTLSINYKLVNYIVYNPNEHPKYNITIHELTEYEDFIQSINDKKNMHVALFPTTSINLQRIFNIKYTKNKDFKICNMYKHIEDEIIERCITFINTLDDNIDILIFPEMLITENIINSLREIIVNKGIKFVFFGSIWKDGNNICRVFYEGDEIFKYYKKIPFDLKYNKKQFEKILEQCDDKNQLDILNTLYKEHDFTNQIIFKEGLKPESNVHVIDINYFGRILTYICRDIDDDCYMNVTKILQGDFIILPACSPSNDLSNGAAILSERNHCTTIMCNTCSSLCENNEVLTKKIEKKNHIGFIVTPSKDDTTRSHKKIFYNFGEKCKYCNEKCNGHIFTINFEELFFENSSVSLDIKEIGR